MRSLLLRQAVASACKGPLFRVLGHATSNARLPFLPVNKGLTRQRKQAEWASKFAVGLSHATYHTSYMTGVGNAPKSAQVACWTVCVGQEAACFAVRRSTALSTGSVSKERRDCCWLEARSGHMLNPGRISAGCLLPFDRDPVLRAVLLRTCEHVSWILVSASHPSGCSQGMRFRLLQLLHHAGHPIHLLLPLLPDFALLLQIPTPMGAKWSNKLNKK